MLNKFLKVNLDSKTAINNAVTDNFSKLKFSLFLIPLLFLSAIFLFLFRNDALTAAKYSEIQKPFFLFINSKLSQFPDLIYNLTQMGDALIFLSFLTMLILYAPKVWEALLSALLVSAVFSNVLKNIFAIPRPAATFDNNSFVIIGQKLTGHNSLPSGHSVTVFTILTVLLFAFLPKKWDSKVLWSLFVISGGLLLAFTRVGVGAHYPLDVLSGSSIGIISGISGIFISRKYPIWSWINNKKYYPIFILLFIFCAVVIINKIIDTNLIIFYLTLISLIVSLYQLIYAYIKK